MSQDQDDEEWDREPTASEAKEQQKEHIAWLRKGDKESRHLAKVLARCCKGNRCSHKECEVCVRRAKRAARRIGSVIELIYGSDTPSLQVRQILLEAVKVNGQRRTLNEEKLIATAASMSQIGLRTPITVRTKKKQAILATGLYRLEAARRLGWKTIPCFIIAGNEIEARPWELSENLYRAVLTVLERAEHIDELRAIIRRRLQGGQAAPPGGEQPKDVGINKAAKALGFTKEEIRRSKAIAGISAKAKEAAKTVGLDNNQEALLEIAKLPTPTTQLKAVKEIDERKRAARARRAAAAVAGDYKAAARIKGIETNIAAKEDKIERLNDKLASQRKRKREIENRLVADSVDTVTAVDSPPLAPADDADASVSTKRDREATKADRHPAFAALQAAWENADELQQAWDDAPAEVRARFVAVVLKVHVS